MGSRNGEFDMSKIGHIYKPSEMSFEDKDRRIQVYQTGHNRVLYTDLKTKENGECSSEDFDWYWDDVLENYIINKRKK